MSVDDVQIVPKWVKLVVGFVETEVGMSYWHTGRMLMMWTCPTVETQTIAMESSMRMVAFYEYGYELLDHSVHHHTPLTIRMMIESCWKMPVSIYHDIDIVS